MPPSIGVNLRVTGHLSQGGRKHMEDMFSVAYQQTEDEKDLEYAFFGIFDGHGGREAAMFAKDHLMDNIVNQKGFWSDCEEEVSRAIKDGYLRTHYAMWRDLETWPKTASGLPSTAGTTASIAFIRKGKIYIGHVGDSQIVLGYQREGQEGWEGLPLTRDHKPECREEIARIEKSGGKVVSKQGVPRVVWNRPRIGHKGPVRRSTMIDEIPFLAVARSLGDLWSYNSELDEFIVSPEPDVDIIPIEVGVHKCLIFGTDGLWNMMTPKLAAQIVHNAEHHNEQHILQVDSATRNHQHWINPSKSLVERAIGIWNATHLRADNTSAVTLMLDPPGPPRAQVLRFKKENPGQPLSGSPGGFVAVFTRYPHRPKPPPPAAKNVVQINEVSSSQDVVEAVPPSVPRPPFSMIKVEKSKVVGRSPKPSHTPDKENPPPCATTSAGPPHDHAKESSPYGGCLKRGREEEDEDTSDAENKRENPLRRLSGDEPRRTLRSDTAAVRTLRSRNVTAAPLVARVRNAVAEKSRTAMVMSDGSRSVPAKRHRPESTIVLRSRARKRWSQ